MGDVWIYNCGVGVNSTCDIFNIFKALGHQPLAHLRGPETMMAKHQGLCCCIQAIVDLAGPFCKLAQGKIFEAWDICDRNYPAVWIWLKDWFDSCSLLLKNYCRY